MDVYENKTVGTHDVIIDNIEVLGIDEKTFTTKMCIICWFL
jgi:hypothetical protein